MVIDYQRFFESSHDLMCVVSRTHFLEVNPAFTETLGYSRAELLSRPYEEFIHPDDLELTREVVKHKALPEYGFENRWVTKSGNVIWLRWTVHPTREDSGNIAYTVGKDVTDAKRIQHELEETLTNLRQRNEDLESFSYAASHDLQEPLRAISTYASFLLEDFGSLLPEEALEHLNAIMDSAKSGRQLVSSLLQVSRLGRSVNFGWVSMDDIVARAVLDEELHTRVSGAVIEEQTGLPRVWGDSPLLLVLLRNLISNAIKFSKPGTIPTIYIGGEATPSGWHFWVRDTGIGIDPQYKGLLFTPFKRLDHSVEGSGIGLSMCRRVAGLHHGKIWIDSIPGEGTTVHFTVARPGFADVHSPTRTTDIPPTDPTDPPGGGQPPRRDGDSAIPVAAEPSSRTAPLPRRGGGTTLLAAGGTLRDRSTPRSGVARFELAPHHGVRSARGSEEVREPEGDPYRRALRF